MNGTGFKESAFKTVILALLIFSILIQIMVSVWFYEKLKNLENRLALYPLNKPVEVDLRVTIPELVEIDGKIDRLTQRLGKVLTSPRGRTVHEREVLTGGSSKSNDKKAKSRGSTQVDVVEQITD